MKQTLEVENVKCKGCANTLISSLKEEFGNIEVNLDVHPRKITLDLDDSKKETLKLKLRALGYPLSTDELSGLQKATTTAKSFVSCAIGKMNT